MKTKNSKLMDETFEACGCSPNRNEDTLFELTANSREHAIAMCKHLARSRKVAWIECPSLNEYAHIQERLAKVGTGLDVFLFLSMPKDYEHWGKVEMGQTLLLDDILFKLWPDENRLYFVRMGGKHSILGGLLEPRNAELGLV